MKKTKKKKKGLTDRVAEAMKKARNDYYDNLPAISWPESYKEFENNTVVSS
jgi:hypothetical protein